MRRITHRIMCSGCRRKIRAQQSIIIVEQGQPVDDGWVMHETERFHTPCFTVAYERKVVKK